MQRAGRALPRSPRAGTARGADSASTRGAWNGQVHGADRVASSGNRVTRIGLLVGAFKPGIAPERGWTGTWRGRRPDVLSGSDLCRRTGERSEYPVTSASWSATPSAAGGTGYPRPANSPRSAPRSWQRSRSAAGLRRQIGRAHVLTP